MRDGPVRPHRAFSLTRTRKGRPHTTSPTTCRRASSRSAGTRSWPSRSVSSARAQQRRVGAQVEVMVDGPSPEHELVWRGRLAGQAPDIDPVVYFTDGRPSESLAARGADFPGGNRGAPASTISWSAAGVTALVINFQVRKSLQDLKWAGAHFLFLRVVLRSSLTEFAPSPSGWPAPTTWRFSTSSSGASRRGGCCGFSSMCRSPMRRRLTTKSAPRTRGCVADHQDCERVSRDVSAILDVEETDRPELHPRGFVARDSIGRCAAPPITGGLPGGWRKSSCRGRSIARRTSKGGWAGSRTTRS